MKFSWFKMQVVLWLLALTLLIACNPKNEWLDGKYSARKTEPSFTIFGTHRECTGCLDLFVDSGVVLVPPDLRQFFGDTLKRFDIVLIGNYPHKVIDGFLNGPESDGYPFYKFTGKLVDTQRNGNSDYVDGIAPVFYVEKCSRAGVIGN